MCTLLPRNMGLVCRVALLEGCCSVVRLYTAAVYGEAHAQLVLEHDSAPTDLVPCLPTCVHSLPCYAPTSACSRETDNQDPDADVNMDVTWQGKLHEQQQHSLQHGGLASGSPAATAARALCGLPGGAFNPSALQWGLGATGLCAPGAADAGSAAAAAASMLSALGPAQVLALLSNPLFFGEWHAATRTCCGGALLVRY